MLGKRTQTAPARHFPRARYGFEPTSRGVSQVQATLTNASMMEEPQAKFGTGRSDLLCFFFINYGNAESSAAGCYLVEVWWRFRSCSGAAQYDFRLQECPAGKWLLKEAVGPSPFLPGIG